MPESDAVIGIVGAGRFGTALASCLATRRQPVMMYSRSREVVSSIEQDRHNPRLPDLPLSELVSATGEAGALTERCQMLLLAVPSSEARQRLRMLGSLLSGRHFLVHAIGGIAPTGELISTVIQQETQVKRCGVMAGPALARDLVAGKFSSVVLASPFSEVTSAGCDLLTVEGRLSVAASDDIVGVELAAAFAGVFAIVVGMADECAQGTVARAVIITRALAEATAIGVEHGGLPQTFSGLAGLGNLLARAHPDSGERSLDYALGVALARGTKPQLLTEGARAALALEELAEDMGMETVVLASTARAITGEMSPAEALKSIAGQ